MYSVKLVKVINSLNNKVLTEEQAEKRKKQAEKKTDNIEKKTDNIEKNELLKKKNK